MSLGLVIPVWNDQAALTRLLHQVHDMTLFDQVVVIDDGSDVPVTVPDLPGLTVVLLRNETPQGPGQARNRGLEAVTTRHVLFFDSDDLLTPEFPALWRDLQGRTFDFCMFRHCDSRQARRGHWGMMGHDAALWREAGMGGRALAEVTDAARTVLVQTANFPWNKIWRTDALRTHMIQYSHTRVHEDIEPHWMGFLRAQHVLASDRIAAVHHVTPGASRLTNLRSRERLEVFEPLERVLSALQGDAPHQKGLLDAFLRFSVTLLDWIRGNLDPHLHQALAQRRRMFWLQAVPPPVFDRLAVEDPDLALRLSLQMVQDRGDAPC